MGVKSVLCNREFGGIELQGYSRGALPPSENLYVKWTKTSSRNMVFKGVRDSLSQAELKATSKRTIVINELQKNLLEPSTHFLFEGLVLRAGA